MKRFIKRLETCNVSRTKRADISARWKPSCALRTNTFRGNTGRKVTKPDRTQKELTGGPMILLGGIYRPLLALARKINLQGTKAVPPTGGGAVSETATVACLGASATAAIGSYDWIADL